MEKISWRGPDPWTNLGSGSWHPRNRNISFSTADHDVLRIPDWDTSHAIHGTVLMRLVNPDGLDSGAKRGQMERWIFETRMNDSCVAKLD